MNLFGSFIRTWVERSYMKENPDTSFIFVLNILGMMQVCKFGIKSFQYA